MVFNQSLNFENPAETTITKCTKKIILLQNNSVKLSQETIVYDNNNFLYFRYVIKNPKPVRASPGNKFSPGQRSKAPNCTMPFRRISKENNTFFLFPIIAF